MTLGKGRWPRAIADDFLESSAAAFAAPYLHETLDEPPAGDRAGAIVGRYRLLQEIGRGGMGSVWLAERADGQFEQRVALKLIKRGMDSDEILARFLRERQILARLEHPNIARLLDGGVSDDGRPYFVMEHVTGTPITASCDARRVGIDERLRLFAVVCRALQHAHRSLVVHRDIKPSNVLVTEGGELKLLDFGVAKLLGEQGADATHAGPRTTIALTPEYASPEQLAREPVTTASDVYQLGILLYELLTGRRPRKRTSRSPDEQSDPAHPSTAVGRAEQVVDRDGTVETIGPGVVSERRSTTPERLRRRLRGDLDAIALRALRAEPDRRYPSPEALAEDVERHLAHLPIRYGDGARMYRAAKFMRRYRLRIAAAVLLVVASVTIGFAYIRQIRSERDRAEREAAKAAETAALLSRFFHGWSPDAADRGKVSAETLLGTAAVLAERELGRDPEMLAVTLSVLGDLQSGLGNAAAADALFGRALTIQERLYRTPSVDVAATLARRGGLLITGGRFPEAESLLRRALAAYGSVLPPERLEILRTEHSLAMALYRQDKDAEAEALLRDVLRRSPIEDAPFTTEAASTLGYVLFRQARYEEASAILRRTLAHQRRVFGELHPSTLATMKFLSASLRGPGSLAEAEALIREALHTSRTLYGEAHATTVFSLQSLTAFLERKGSFAEAESIGRSAVRNAERVWGETNHNTAMALGQLGGALLAQGRRDEAERVLRRAGAAFRRTVRADHPDQIDALYRLAYIVVDRGAADATEIYREAAEFERTRPAAGPFFVTDGYEYLGWAARRMGDAALAERLYRRAVGLYEGELPDGHLYRAQANVGLGETLLAAGRAAEAEHYLRAGFAQWQAARPPQPERVAEARELVGMSRRH